VNQGAPEQEPPGRHAFRHAGDSPCDDPVEILQHIAEIAQVPEPDAARVEPHHVEASLRETKSAAHRRRSHPCSRVPPERHARDHGQEDEFAHLATRFRDFPTKFDTVLARSKPQHPPGIDLQHPHPESPEVGLEARDAGSEGFVDLHADSSGSNCRC
jgi:hypothetical protein